MKKSLLFTTLLLFISAAAFSARMDLSLTDLSSGYGSTYDAASKTITFEGEYKGRGWWLGEADLSAYDQVVVKILPVEFRVQVLVEYSDATNTTVGVDAGGTTITVTLDAAKKANVKQIYLQSSMAGTVTLVEAYVEGEAALPNYELSLSSLGAGWSSSYNATTKTITFDDAWTGRGWWFNGIDFSAYDQVVVEFAQALPFTVKLVIQYMDDSNNTPDVYANEGGSSIIVALDPALSSGVKQIYLQGGAAGDVVLQGAYLTPKTHTQVEQVRSSKLHYANNVLYMPEMADVQLFDMNGRSLMQAYQVITLDLNQLKSGIYVVKAMVDGQLHTAKIVK